MSPTGRSAKPTRPPAGRSAPPADGGLPFLPRTDILHAPAAPSTPHRGGQPAPYRTAAHGRHGDHLPPERRDGHDRHRRSDDDAARLAARGPGPHGHQGGLQRGGLRRLLGHRHRRPQRPPAQRLHPVPASDPRARGADGRRDRGARRHAASGAGGVDRAARVAMRLLHAWLRHHDGLRASERRHRPRRPDRRQPVPLHRLRADPGRGAGRRRRGGARPHARRAA